jgi:predicted dehydrogenase
MAKEGILRFGILGAARIAPDALIKPAKIVEGVEATAIAARDPARAREFADLHGIPRIHSSYEDLINDPELDVIYNPLPNSLHCEWSIAALNAGKHVLCEKPIAANAREAERMAAAARDSGCFLAEAFHYSYHPLAARVREIINGGTLGPLNFLEANFSVPMKQPNIRFEWELAGGATMDLGCYPLHMLRSFTGLKPKVIRAAARTGPPKIDIAMEVELEMTGGVHAKMTCSMAPDAHIGAWFKARGEHGELNVINPVGPHWGNQITIKGASGESNETIKGDTTFTYQLRAFVAAMRGQGTFPTDAIEGIDNMRVIDDVYRAAGLPPRGT